MSLTLHGNSVQLCPVTDQRGVASATGNCNAGAVQNDTVGVTNPGTQSSTTGDPVSVQIAGTDSSPTATLSYSATGLPPGLSIGASNGQITGTPTTAGTYSVTVSITDDADYAASTAFNWDISNTVGVTNPGTQSSTTGNPVSVQIAGTDSGGLTLTYGASGLPPGLSISSSGLITGTPTTGGSFSMTVSARDSTGADGATRFTWNVVTPGLPPSKVSLHRTPRGPLPVGSDVTYRAKVSKNSAPGNLTGSVTFTDNGIAIPGCSTLRLVERVAVCTTSYPTTSRYVIAANYSGDPAFANSSATLTQIIFQVPSITSTNHITAAIGTSFSLAVTASGYPAPAIIESGTLPGGVGLSGGVLSGTPAPGTSGSYQITITAMNRFGVSHQSFSLTVDRA
jgi:hypothetical protein